MQFDGNPFGRHTLTFNSQKFPHSNVKMTKLDIGILILVGLAGISCYRAGFTRSVWGLFVIGLGFFAACQFWGQLARVIQKLIADPNWAKWLSIVLIVLAVSLLVDSFFERIQRILERGVLGWVNHLLGLGIGVASGGLVIAFALILLNTYGGDSFKNEIANSRLAPHLTDIGNRVWAVGKARVQKQLDIE